MEVRSCLMKKRTTSLEDEVMLRKGREKSMWIALLVSCFAICSFQVMVVMKWIVVSTDVNKCII